MMNLGALYDDKYFERQPVFRSLVDSIRDAPRSVSLDRLISHPRERDRLEARLPEPL